MSKQLKLRRGTTAQHSTFTGAEGEVTVDTTKDTLVVHDGVTAGGKPLATEAGLAGKQPLSNNLTTYASTGIGFRNRIINGDMRIDQRNAGASVTVSTSLYTLDRWNINKNGLNNFTCQRSTAAPAGFSNSMLLTMGTGVTPTGTDFAYLAQNIEGFNAADLAWGTASAQTVTLSFWVRSSVTGTFGVGLRNTDGTRAYISAYTISAANTWELKTVTVPGAPSGTWLTDNGVGIRVDFDLGVGPTYSGAAGSWLTTNTFGLTSGTKLAATTGATFYITGVQLEAGTVATPFERRDYGRELMMCQRYYEVITTSNAVFGFPAYCASPSIARGAIQFKVTKRATPTPVLMSTLAATNINCIPGNFNPTSTSFYADVNSVGFDLTIGTNSFINGQGCAIGITGTGLTISSEL